MGKIILATSNMEINTPMSYQRESNICPNSHISTSLTTDLRKTEPKLCYLNWEKTQKL